MELGPDPLLTDHMREMFFVETARVASLLLLLHNSPSWYDSIRKVFKLSKAYFYVVGLLAYVLSYACRSSWYNMRSDEARTQGAEAISSVRCSQSHSPSAGKHLSSGQCR